MDVGLSRCINSTSIAPRLRLRLTRSRSYFPSMRWPFQPVVDYKVSNDQTSRLILTVRLQYISGPAHKSWEAGAFQKVNILTGEPQPLALRQRD